MSDAVVGRITMSKGPNNSLYFSMMPLQNECDRLREDNKKLRAALKELLKNFHVGCAGCEVIDAPGLMCFNLCPQKCARNIAEQVLKETKEETHV